MSAKSVTVMVAAILVGGTLLAAPANAASATNADHNIYSGHKNSAAIDAEHNVYAGHKAGAGAPYGYKHAPGDHALGGGPG
jgi:hypothetical protein